MPIKRLKNDKSETYFTTKECAQFIGRSAGAVRNLVMRHKIPFRKPSGRLMFLKSELERWIEESPGITVDAILDSKKYFIRK